VTAVAIGLTAMASVAQAASSNPTINSPLRVGTKPGCRWVEAPAKTTRVCNPTTKVCRTQTVPPQRIWACGTVRD
jgi:hypothetical protein